MSLNFSNTAIGRLRIAGIAEGISFLFLLLIAMPLKYLADIPEAVLITGWIHGALFILYITALLYVWRAKRWPVFRVAVGVGASLIPFGTFITDKKLRNEENALVMYSAR